MSLAKLLPLSAFIMALLTLYLTYVSKEKLSSSLRKAKAEEEKFRRHFDCLCDALMDPDRKSKLDKRIDRHRAANTDLRKSLFQVKP